MRQSERFFLGPPNFSYIQRYLAKQGYAERLIPKSATILPGRLPVKTRLYNYEVTEATHDVPYEATRTVLVVSKENLSAAQIQNFLPGKGVRNVRVADETTARRYFSHPGSGIEIPPVGMTVPVLLEKALRQYLMFLELPSGDPGYRILLTGQELKSLIPGSQQEEFELPGFRVDDSAVRALALSR